MKGTDTRAIPEKSPILSPPCMAVHDLMPEIRRDLAVELRGQGMSQEAIANALGITQASVSHYLREAENGQRKEAPWHVGELYRSAAADLVAGRDPIPSFCAICRRVRASGALCLQHGLVDCNFCMSIETPERREVLEELTRALGILGSLDLGGCVPEVGMNIAVALEGARDYGDVAAVPGRIRAHRGRIVGEYTPEFGASRHLAGMLLRTGGKAVTNMRYREAIMDRFPGEEVEVIERIDGRDASDYISTGSSVVVDPGWVGMEPCVYLFGDSALDVVLKVKRILKR